MALHAKAKAEADYRFYALYDKISREDILAHAYAQCRSNKGAPGVDGQDFADIEAYGVDRWLAELALALRQETRDLEIGHLTTPNSVQKLQTALHAKAKAEAGYRFYALYDKISREDILAHAYAQCRSNKGAPGVDGQDFADIEACAVQR